MQVCRTRVDLVEQRDDRFFVRDGQVDAGEFLPGQCKRVDQLLGRHSDRDVVGIPTGCREECGVQVGTHGVTERIAEQRVGLALGLEGLEFFKRQQHDNQPPKRCSASKKSG